MFLTAALLGPILIAASDEPNARSPNDGDRPGALPRYRLHVGQELVYQLTDSVDPRQTSGLGNDDRSPALRNQMEWRILVTRQNADGSWRLYIRDNVALIHPDGSERYRHESLGYCDLHPDGSYTLDEQTAVFKKLFPYELFARLPDTLADLAEGWEYEPPVMGRRWAFGLAQGEGGRWHLAGVQEDLYSEINNWEISSVYDFDRDRGLVVSIVQEWKDLATDRVNNRRTVLLTECTRRDAAWVARFDEDAQRYLEVDREWMRVCYEGFRAHTLGACRTARAQARALLLAGRDEATLDVIRERYDAQIRAHDAEDQWMLNVARRREEFFTAVSEFSTTWEAKSFDGKMFRLADQRGKVVVLFFWVTGCEYNMIAAPHLSRLATEYEQESDVAIIGIYVKESEGDRETRARDLIAQHLHELPQMEAQHIPEVYEFRRYGLAYPTILVLDQAGIVREALTGYEADLAERTREWINELREAE